MPLTTAGSPQDSAAWSSLPLFVPDFPLEAELRACSATCTLIEPQPSHQIFTRYTRHLGVSSGFRCHIRALTHKNRSTGKLVFPLFSCWRISPWRAANCDWYCERERAQPASRRELTLDSGLHTKCQPAALVTVPKCRPATSHSDTENVWWRSPAGTSNGSVRLFDRQLPGPDAHRGT